MRLRSRRLSEEIRSGITTARAWHGVCGRRGLRLTGADLTISGNVPQSAGLSSSASVEVATATALLGLAGKTLPGPEIALACQRAENEYVHGSCGIMDQYISACGVKGNALAIDTRALTAELAPIPEALRLVVCNSMVTHKVAGESPYARSAATRWKRRRMCSGGSFAM